MTSANSGKLRIGAVLLVASSLTVVAYQTARIHLLKVVEASPNLPDILAVVRVPYSAGVPYSEVKRFRGDASALTALKDELEHGDVAFRRNVVLTIGMIGGPESVADLERYLISGKTVGVIDAQSKGDALWAIGYLAHFLADGPSGVPVNAARTRSPAVSRCIEILVRFSALGHADVGWRSKYFPNEGLQRLYLSERAIEGLGFTGLPEALKQMEFIESHLKTVLSPGSQISREPYATLKRDLKAGDIDDLRDIVRETRVVHAFVQKNKLDLYFQQVQSVAVRR